VRAGGAIASLGVLLSLVAGVSRTTLAMARRRELPGALAAVHPARSVPQRAELAVGAAVIAIVLAAGDVRDAIGFSSFTVLAYYALANASAWTLPAAQRRWPRALNLLGVVGCAALAVTLPLPSVLEGAGVLAAGLAARALARSRRD
jgi:APA family basic amino acid/polyamine antiporter